MAGRHEEYQDLARRKRFREAAELAREEHARASAPRDVAFWLTREASALTRAGEHEAALKAARRALEADGSDAFAVYAAAEALAGLGRHREAMEHFEEASRHERLASRARRKVLDCLEAQGQWEELLSRLPTSGLPSEDVAGYEVRSLAGVGRREEALARCRTWLVEKPHHPQALWLLQDLEIEGEGLEAVLERYGRLARIPSLPQVYREIHASLCRRAGRTEEAIREYAAIGASGGGSRAQRQQAFALAKSGHELEAIPLIEELLRGDPKDLYLHSSYGGACRRAGQLERAVNFYNTLIGLHPEERSLYGRMNKLRKAMEAAP